MIYQFDFPVYGAGDRSVHNFMFSEIGNNSRDPMIRLFRGRKELILQYERTLGIPSDTTVICLRSRRVLTSSLMSIVMKQIFEVNESKPIDQNQRKFLDYKGVQVYGGLAYSKKPSVYLFDTLKRVRREIEIPELVEDELEFKYHIVTVLHKGALRSQNNLKRIVDHFKRGDDYLVKPIPEINAYLILSRFEHTMFRLDQFADPLADFKSIVIAKMDKSNGENLTFIKNILAPGAPPDLISNQWMKPDWKVGTPNRDFFDMKREMNLSDIKYLMDFAEEELDIKTKFFYKSRSDLIQSVISSTPSRRYFLYHILLERIREEEDPAFLLANGYEIITNEDEDESAFYCWKPVDFNKLYEEQGEDKMKDIKSFLVFYDSVDARMSKVVSFDVPFFCNFSYFGDDLNPVYQSDWSYLDLQYNSEGQRNDVMHFDKFTEEPFGEDIVSYNKKDYKQYCGDVLTENSDTANILKVQKNLDIVYEMFNIETRIPMLKMYDFENKKVKNMFEDCTLYMARQSYTMVSDIKINSETRTFYMKKNINLGWLGDDMEGVGISREGNRVRVEGPYRVEDMRKNIVIGSYENNFYCDNLGFLVGILPEFNLLWASYVEKSGKFQCWVHAKKSENPCMEITGFDGNYFWLEFSPWQTQIDIGNEELGYREFEILKKIGDNLHLTHPEKCLFWWHPVIRVPLGSGMYYNVLENEFIDVDKGDKGLVEYYEFEGNKLTAIGYRGGTVAAIDDFSQINKYWFFESEKADKLVWSRYFNNGNATFEDLRQFNLRIFG